MAAVFEAAGLLGKDIHVAMCGGVESMSRVQIGVSQGLSDWIRRLSQARSFGDRVDRFLEVRGATSSSTSRASPTVPRERAWASIARRWRNSGTSRASDQDRIALQSHQRAVAAMTRGFFDDLVTAVEGVAKDGIPRADSSAEKLASLKPAFDRTSGKGTITAGNASPLTDGAAAVWVADDEGLGRLPPARPRARLVDFEIAAVDIFHEGC
jgi:acetyl-CoA C-acetyltransferase